MDRSGLQAGQRSDLDPFTVKLTFDVRVKLAFDVLSRSLGPSERTWRHTHTVIL